MASNPYSYIPTYLTNWNRIETLRACHNLFQLWKNRDDLYEAVFKIFQVDLDNYFKNEFILLKELHLQPSEIDSMEYYRFQLLISNYEEYLEKERKEREKEEAQGREQFNLDKTIKDQKGMMNQQMPKMNMPNFKMPAFK